VRGKAAIFWLFGWALLFAPVGWAGEPVLSVYFPDYRYKKGVEPAFYGTTHLVLFSAKPHEDGSVDFGRITPGLLEVGEKARANGVTVTFCVGGWGRGKEFATAVSTEEGRARFVGALAGFCAEHDLGGVDIDWEFPKGEEEHADFAKFLASLSARLHGEGRILTAALGYTRPLDRECYGYLDQVNLMSYQPWSPQDYEKWLREAVERMLESGLPPEKLVVGVGFFAKEKGGERRAVSYRKMTGEGGAGLPKSEHGWWPAGKEACALRLKLVEEFGLGGVMVWDYGHDAVAPEESLLRYLPEGYEETLPKPALNSIRRKYKKPLDEKIAKQVLQSYYASISFADAQVGRILDALEVTGLQENTIVLFTSDHGYHMGEHGHYQKTTLFENATHVPLVMAGPGITAKGKASNSPAEMVDFYPTLAELAGIKPPEHISGISLVPVLKDPAATPRKSAFTQYGTGYSIRDQRYRYTEWGDKGTEGAELYDHESDPAEMNNLAANPEYKAKVKELSTQLQARITKANVPPKGVTQREVLPPGRTPISNKFAPK